jgi:lipopolysaccharide heptosyltransferase I
MYTAAKAVSSILVVRLGAMGDIIHALPAVASLKNSHPGSRITWIVEPRWAPLLEDNPFVDRVTLLRRDSLSSLFASWRALRSGRYDLAVDFQGLIKSALTASSASPRFIFGFHHSQVRERAAALFYSNKTRSSAAHVVDRNLDLAAAAGAATMVRVFPIPAGRPEGDLPGCDFVLASPLAGWRSKQWPMEHYQALAARLHHDLGIPLVLNLPPGTALPPVRGALLHFSGLPGLIDATRRAAAVLGVDSGPMHLAAALGRPGVAIFGPTDPSRNGPYGGVSLKVLRAADAATTYKRGSAIDDSMRRVGPDEVFETLKTVLGGCLV